MDYACEFELERLIINSMERDFEKKETAMPDTATTVTTMTDADLTQFLVNDAIPQDIGNARMAYAAGYFEATLLSLMARYPMVRKEIEDRVNFRKGNA